MKQLRDDGYDPFPKQSKGPRATGVTTAVASADDEDDDDNDDEAGSGKDKGDASDYNYLLSMALWSLTLERVQDLKAQRDAKKEELAALLKLSIEDLWRTDLDNLRFAFRYEMFFILIIFFFFFFVQ